MISAKIQKVLFILINFLLRDVSSLLDIIIHLCLLNFPLCTQFQTDVSVCFICHVLTVPIWRYRIVYDTNKRCSVSLSVHILLNWLGNRILWFTTDLFPNDYVIWTDAFHWSFNVPIEALEKHPPNNIIIMKQIRCERPLISMIVHITFMVACTHLDTSISNYRCF